MTNEVRELNDFVKEIKNVNEINCAEHIQKKFNKYVWCLNLINSAINKGDIIDNELKNAIVILQQIIQEGQNNITHSKTGFCAYEGQDRAHIHSLRYLIVSKIKKIFCKDKNGNFFSFPINENAEIDINNVELIKKEYTISFETYMSNTNTRIIKLSIVDENVNDFNRLKQYDFVVNLDKIEKVYCKKTTGVIIDCYYPFQYYGLKHVKSVEKIIFCKKNILNEKNLNI